MLCWGLGRDGLELRPLMDLWIMGLLYELIVRGSRLHGAFGEKGLVRSVDPTGGMSGRSPVFSLGFWRIVCLDGGTKRRLYGRQREDEHEPCGLSVSSYNLKKKRREQWIPQIGAEGWWKGPKLRPQLNLLRGNNCSMDFPLFVYVLFSLLFISFKFFLLPPLPF